MIFSFIFPLLLLVLCEPHYRQWSHFRSLCGSSFLASIRPAFPRTIRSAYLLLIAGFLVCLFFDPEDGSSFSSKRRFSAKLHGITSQKSIIIYCLFDDIVCSSDYVGGMINE
jgi:hypothetical protein